jgi:hypothetical protein
MIVWVIISLVISIIALILAILAYSKAGGIPELKTQTEGLREKTAKILNKAEESLRAREKKEPGETKEV